MNIMYKDNIIPGLPPQSGMLGRPLSTQFGSNLHDQTDWTYQLSCKNNVAVQVIFGA